MADLDDNNVEACRPTSAEIVFQRAVWKHVSRWIVFVSAAGLNFAMAMSLLERYHKHMVVHPGSEVVQFLFLLLCDLYFLPVCLLEVNSVTARSEEIIVANLLWKARLTKNDIVSLQMPKMLTWAILRTRRCFYLINRTDIIGFHELTTLIGERYLR